MTFYSPSLEITFETITNGDFVVPARSHSKVPVVNPFATNNNNSISGTFGSVSPRKSLTTCMVTHGVSNFPTWVQVTNLLIHLYLFDMVLMFVIFIHEKNRTPKEAFIEPTTEDSSSGEVTRSALRSEGHTPHPTSSQVPKGCQNKAGASHFQQTHNVKGRQGEGLITLINPYPYIGSETGTASTRETWSTSTVGNASHRKHPGDQGYQIEDQSRLVSEESLPTWTARETTRPVRPGMRAGQAVPCTHEYGSDVGPMTMLPIPKAGTNTAFVCDPVGPLVNGGRTEEAEHVRQHALWSASYLRYLDSGTRPEQEPLMVARPGKPNRNDTLDSASGTSRR